MSLSESITKLITNAVGASSFEEKEVVQELWSGYGNIIRYKLHDAEIKSIIVKAVHPPKNNEHPRGWNTNISHERKLKSYQIETNWYNDLSIRCDDSCRVPKCFCVEKNGEDVIIILEDLNDSGFPLRRSSIDLLGMESCIRWLANFHAEFISIAPKRLWEQGTYWHLATRPDELDVLDDFDLKKYAAEIDKELNNSRFQTIVHGDAKLANFCFSKTGDVAAVDFQYVGGGCGMKDLVYFIGSCLHEEDCERYEDRLLSYYFDQLESALKQRNSSIQFVEIEQDWRKLYPFAWADFHRFLKGWSPGHWKINSYSEKITKSVIHKLKQRR